MFDERHQVREFLKRVRKKRAKIYYHTMAWALYISYEISLSAAIRESFSRFSDYVLHYLLYIILFYVHCYLVLGTSSHEKLLDYRRLLIYVLPELACFYFCNVLINEYLLSSGSPINVIPTYSRLFHLAAVYRFFYIISFSTALRIGLNLLKSLKRNHVFVMETLTREKETEELRNELLSSELAFLRSQVEPHLLFNALNSLYNRIRKNDTQSAEYIMALADLMKYSLQTKDATDLVQVERELEHISNYMELQHMRFGADIGFNVSVEEKELEIIPRLLNSLIENIFQHGDLYHPRSKPLIEITVANGELVLRTKNVIRSDHQPGHGIGLPNTRERLERHYKDRYSLEYGADHQVFTLKLLIKLR